MVHNTKKFVWISKMLFQYTDNPEREFKLQNECVAAETVNVVAFLIRELCFGFPSQPRNLFCKSKSIILQF